MEVAEETVYRDAGEGLRSEREELLAARRREIGAMPVAVVDVYARRFARVVAGMVGIGVAVVSALLLAAGAETALVFVPVGAALTLVTSIAARLAGRARIRRRLASDFSAGPDVRADVDRLLRDTPFAVVRRMADAHEPCSVVLAVMAMTLLIPLVAESGFAWLAVYSGRAWPTPHALWNRLFLPQCGGLLITGAVMIAVYSRNVRLETVNQLMNVYRGSVMEAWFTALLVGAMWGGIACGAQFLAPLQVGAGVWRLDSITAGEMGAFFVIWGGIGLWLLMAAVAAPLFAVLHRRVEAERATLGLSAHDFLRRER